MSLFRRESDRQGRLFPPAFPRPPKAEKRWMVLIWARGSLIPVLGPVTRREAEAAERRTRGLGRHSILAIHEGWSALYRRLQAERMVAKATAAAAAAAAALRSASPASIESKPIARAIAPERSSPPARPHRGTRHEAESWARSEISGAKPTSRQRGT